MNKKVLKTISILVLAIALLFTLVLPAFATDYLDPTSIVANDTSGAQKSINNIANSILAIAQTVGIAVAVIMLIVLAIKYISAAPNDKAEIKKHAVVYIVGAIVLFSASGLLGIIRNFSKNISDK